MFCPGCGTEVPEGKNFCPKCGHKLTSNLNIKSVANSSSSTESINDKWNGYSTGKKVILALAVCCIGFMIVGFIGSIISPDANTSTYDSSSIDDAESQQIKEDSKVKFADDYSNVQVDRYDLGDYYSWSSLAYDHTTPYTINGVDGYLFVGDGSVEFYYQDGSHYYELAGDINEKDKVLKKMETMV